MKSKICFKCHQDKILSMFYKHSKMDDGYLNKCKECTKKDTIKNRVNNIEYYRDYDRKRSNLDHRVENRRLISEKWAKDPILKKKRNKLSAEWIIKNKEKRAAHVLTGYAIKSGKLIKQPCEICKKKKVEAHHNDYAKPLEVRWFCRKHHMEYHKQERERLRKST